MQGGFWIDEDGVHRFWLGSKKYDSCGGKTFRHIRTTQERKEYLDDYDGYRVCCRRRDLPEYRDEIMRDYGSTKSWKHNRKKQWRE